MHPAPTSELDDSVTLAVRLPRALYDTFAELCEGDVAERVAAFVAQVAPFGCPADLHQDLEATTEELAALRTQLATVALMLADVGQPHPL